ncbi:MAG: MerR family DNA-binding transcriptional regulator [Deltaproteobacteria bacterium]|nr:MerR family DNA-binding transcriptional regulator [Deltaproteobacteria bacterium]
METFKDFLTIKEAAEFIGVTTETLRNWDRRGKLIPNRHPVNDYRLYRKSDLEDLLKSIRSKKK